MKRVTRNIKNASVIVAKDRLHQLLSADRLNCSPMVINQMKMDVYQTISKYMEIKPEDLQMTLTRKEMLIRYTGEE